jgi:hypothetical protein
MQPLVLAIEPDLRQAAIVKRIVREKVLADVTVVDSRDAALEAMRTSVPDVLLLSTLLSPRDEDELIAHLRTLEHAEHLQTHTIPQLASSIAHGEERPAKGLLASWWRRKGSAGAPAGCDPDLFAEEIRSYLQRASEKKREVRDGGAAEPITDIRRTRKSVPAAAEPTPSPSPAPSSWESPFEWRPSAAPRAIAPEAPAVTAEPAAAASVDEPEPLPAVAESPIAESVIAESVIAEPVLAVPELLILPEPRERLPLVVRHAREWWYEDDEKRPAAGDPDSELREVLAALEIPLHVATIGGAEGCRIRRVRLAGA